jgi:chitin-binding protein
VKVNSTNNQPIVSRFKSLNAFGLSALLGAVTLLGTIEASAHGYISSPKSRAFACTSGQGGGSSAACIAAAAAGNASQYEPQSINIGGANNNHQALIPDGKLCSAGKAGFGGLDLARNDWVATTVSAGPRAFVWTNTAQHKTTYFRYYITKVGFNPGAAPLKWSDLEQIHQSAPTGQEATSTHIVNLPQRTGRHIIYSIWQRDAVTDAPEGFYQCVDVIYGVPNSSSSVAVTSSSSSTSVASSSVSNNTCAGLPTWNATTAYTNPQQVQHNARRYSANYWTQGNDPALTNGQYNYWLDLGACSEGDSSASSVVVSSSSRSAVSSSRSSSSAAPSNCSSPAFVNGASYATGALVQNGGSEYSCTVGGWCSQGGAYAPGTGWAWANAWSLVRSCQ